MDTQRGGPTGRPSQPHRRAAVSDAATASSPCGACKFLRRKCINGCIFASHFNSDQGAAKFAAVHKVFGASNVSKLLNHVPINRRNDAVVTICYEAQARLADPVYGCVSTIIALQQQVGSLERELSMVQTQLMNTRIAIANALQNGRHQHQHLPRNINVSFSNAPSSSASGIHNTFTTDFTCEAIRLDSLVSGHLIAKEVEEEESRDQVLAFVDQVFHS